VTSDAVAFVQYHEAKIADLEALAMRYQDTVALFTPFGGGWWNGPPGKEANARVTAQIRA
jgi:hypothetical protein